MGAGELCRAGAGRERRCGPPVHEQSRPARLAAGVLAGDRGGQAQAGQQAEGLAGHPREADRRALVLGFVIAVLGQRARVQA